MEATEMSKKKRKAILWRGQYGVFWTGAISQREFQSAAKREPPKKLVLKVARKLLPKKNNKNNKKKRKASTTASTKVPVQKQTKYQETFAEEARKEGPCSEERKNNNKKKTLTRAPTKEPERKLTFLLEAVEMGDLDFLAWETRPYRPFTTERLDDADAVTGIIGLHAGCHVQRSMKNSNI